LSSTSRLSFQGWPASGLHHLLLYPLNENINTQLSIEEVPMPYIFVDRLPRGGH
jgi:hypothetical protein